MEPEKSPSIPVLTLKEAQRIADSPLDDEETLKFMREKGIDPAQADSEGAMRVMIDGKEERMVVTKGDLGTILDN